MKELLGALDYELVEPSGQKGTKMTDPKDIPIIDAAISGDVDCVISGDKHFLKLNLEKPKTLAPADFIAKFVTLSD